MSTASTAIHTSSPDSVSSSAPPRLRFLSEAECQDIARRLARVARGGGESAVSIVSRWTGNVRWARNRISTAGEDRDNRVLVSRLTSRGWGAITVNDISDEALTAAARRAERIARMFKERAETDVAVRADSPFQYRDEPAPQPQLFYESTYQLDARRRAEAARALMQSSAAAGMMSAGYIQVSATSRAVVTSWGHSRYQQYTWAQYSVTVRHPQGIGSGWAGVDWPDWTKIDASALTARALDKCVRSRNPVRVEPGRYTTILEPQAVCDFIGQMMFFGMPSRGTAEIMPGAPFHKSGSTEPTNVAPSQLGMSHLGEKVIDERITIAANPLDPDLAFPTFGVQHGLVWEVPVYHPAVWIEHGILKNLPYAHHYATTLLGKDTGLPNSGAFRMSVSGSTNSVEEMIATTKRGLLVTRFDQILGPIGPSLQCRGYTRDGLWFIEDGKITKPAQNLVFVESILFALNKVEQLGVPERVFHPLSQSLFAMEPFVWSSLPEPVIVPPLKIGDFSFTALTDAV